MHIRKPVRQISFAVRDQTNIEEWTRQHDNSDEFYLNALRPHTVYSSSQIPLRYHASEPARELVRQHELAGRSELEFGLSRTI